MSDTSNEGRTQSTYGIHDECHECSNSETQKVYTCISDNWVLHEYVKAMSSNGNLTAEQLAEFFWFAAETIDEVGKEFDDVNIDMIDWNELAAFYKEA